MKLCIWPVAILAAFAATSCDAAQAASREANLFRRSRTNAKQEPFIVSFRVAFNNGPDNQELAKNLSAKINTPGSPLAAEMGYSVARVFNGTFPPVQWPPSTTAGPGMTQPPTAAPKGMFATPPPATTPAPTALQTAMEALRIAQENRINYDKLTQKMTRATRAHAEALVFGNPSGEVPRATLAPREERKRQASLVPHTLGRLIYDAFVNTPAPMVMTTPMPTPAVPEIAVAGTVAPTALDMTR